MSLENVENFNETIDEQDVDDQFDLTHFYLKTLEDTADQGESLPDFLRGLAHVRGEYAASSEDLTELRRFLGLESREVSEEFVASEELARSESLESVIDEYRISVEGSIRSDIFDILERFDEGSEYFGEEPIGIKGFEPIHPLAHLTDDEIVKILDKLRTDIKRLQLENQIYLDVLKQEDSSIFESADNFVEIKLNKQISRKSINRIQASNDNEDRVCHAQKSDLVLRQTQTIKTKLNIFEKKSHKLLCNLRAEIQEINARRSELRDIIEFFESTFNLLDESQNLKKIPLEKFVCFIKDSMRRMIIVTDKIRLNTGLLKKQYKNVCLLIKQKEQIGTDIYPVDLQLLQIERERLQQKIESKTNLLKNLHGMNGSANLALSDQTKILLKNESYLKKLQKSIAVNESKVVRLEKECRKIIQELQKHHVKV